MSSTRIIQNLINGLLIVTLAVRSVLSCELILIDYVLLIGTPLHFIWTQITG